MKKNVYLILGIILVLTNGIKGLTENLVSKLEYHQKNGVSLGELALYFSQSQAYQEPINEVLIGKNKKFVYTFPATMAKDVKQKAQTINALSNGLYKISIDEKNNGITIALEFDPEKIGLKIESFRAIKMEKGIKFTFINKEFLKKIHAKRDKPVLTTVCAPKPFKVMIDCGHGGNDSGAIGFLGRAEKDITLDVGLQVAHLLKKNGYQPAFTRTDDKTVGLSQRTLLANLDSDLFISIHANSSGNKTTKGIETYCLDYKLFEPCFSTLDQKFATCFEHIEKKRCVQSNMLAQCVQSKVVQTVAQRNSNSNRNVRHAVSQVLLGTNMPAILIEVGFLTNEQEALLLYNKQYQQLLAQGICNGIISYITTTKSA